MGRHFQGRNIQSSPREEEAILLQLDFLEQALGSVADTHIHFVAVPAIPDTVVVGVAAGNCTPSMDFPSDPRHQHLRRPRQSPSKGTRRHCVETSF